MAEPLVLNLNGVPEQEVACEGCTALRPPPIRNKSIMNIPPLGPS